MDIWEDDTKDDKEAVTPEDRGYGVKHAKVNYGELAYKHMQEAERAMTSLRTALKSEALATGRISAGPPRGAKKTLAQMTRDMRQLKQSIAHWSKCAKEARKS